MQLYYLTVSGVNIKNLTTTVAIHPRETHEFFSFPLLHVYTLIIGFNQSSLSVIVMNTPSKSPAFPLLITITPYSTGFNSYPSALLV